MKKLLKRSGALLIVFAMLLSMTVVTAFAADTSTISVSLADGSDTVDVTGGAVDVMLVVSIENNPGITSIEGQVSLPEGWSIVADSSTPTLAASETSYNGVRSAFRGSTFAVGVNGKFAVAASANVTGDGAIFWLPVTIPADTVSGNYDIGVTVTLASATDPDSMAAEGTYELDLSNFTAVGSTVTVIGAAGGDTDPVDPDPDPVPPQATGGTVTVGSVSLTPDDGTVLVPVSISDNPGVAGMKLIVSVPDGLTGVSVQTDLGDVWSVAEDAGLLIEYGINEETGDVTVTMAGSRNLTKDGYLFWVEIGLDETAANGDFDIGVQVEEAFDVNDYYTNAASTYTTSSGKVSVSGLLEGGTVTAGAAAFELTGTATSVLVPVSITGNPGFASMKLTVSVPEGWTTNKVYFTNGDAEAVTVDMLNSYKIDAAGNSDVVITLAASKNVTADGVLAWIQYVPGSSVAEGEYPITVTVNEAYSVDDLNTNAASAYKTAGGVLTVTEVKGGTVTAGTVRFELTEAATSVLVPVSITDNPGFASMKLTVSVPEGWTTNKVYFTNGDEEAVTVDMLNSYKIDAAGNCDVVITLAASKNVTADGVLAWIQYVPDSSVAEGTYPITVTVNEAYSVNDLNTNAAYVYKTVGGVLNVTEVKGGTVTAGAAAFELTGTATSVLVPVSITGNPGFASMKLTVSVPEGWTTTKVYFENGDEEAVTIDMLNSYKIDAAGNSDVVITLAASKNVTADGVLAWIQYVPDSSVAEGEYPITVTVNEAYSVNDLNTNAAYVYKTVDGVLNVTEVKGGTVTVGTAALNLSGDASVLVPVSITGNPGFASMKLTVSVPEGWTTTKVYFENGDAEAVTIDMLNSYKIDAAGNSDVVITLAASKNVTADGVLAWIEYVPGSSVLAGEYPISVTVNEAYSVNDLNTNAAYVYKTVDGEILGSFYNISIADNVDGTADVHEGDEVVMYVTVSGAEFNGAQATVTYDSDLFTYVSCDEEDENTTADNTTAGQIKLTVLSEDRLPSGTAVATLRFIAKDVEETTTGDFEVIAGTADVFIRAASNDAQPAATSGDSVRIVKQFTVTFLDQDGQEIDTYTVDDGAAVSEVPAALAVDNHTYQWYIVEDGSIGETGYTADEILASAVTADVTYQAVYTANSYDVTLGEGLTGETTATYGVDYTGTITGYDGSKYSYTVTYTVGESSEEKTAQVTGDTFTIPGEEITGALSVAVTPTAQTYAVTLDEGLTGATTATYGVDYTGTITDYDGENYSYTVTYTVGGEEKTAQVTDGAFTIPGEEITGALSVALTSVPNSYDVTLDEGLTDEEGKIESVTATHGENFVGLIVGYNSDLYSYTVTYTIGASGVVKTALVNADGTFTIPGDEITGAVSITLTTIAKEFNVEVYADYVTGYTLVTVTNLTDDDSVVYNYDGNAMYYVAAYDAYAWIVAGDLDVDAAEALVTIGTEAAGTIAAGSNVNASDLVDFNDALAAFGCYRVVSEYPVAENIALYLRADVNSDHVVDATDVSLVLASY